MINKNNKYCIFVSYDGLLDPLGNSQILPYLEGLSQSGFQFLVLSFEKTDRSNILINELKKKLNSKNINWIYLPFKKESFGYFKRIFKSYFLIKKTIKNKKIIMFHTRGILTAVLYIICRFKCPFIYDMRSFAGEYIDIKRVKPNSIFAYALILFEKFLINISSGIVVLDETGAEFLKQNYKKIKSEIEVIPTCTNIKNFPIINKSFKEKDSKILKFVFLGGARFPYRPDLALIFIKKLLENNINCTIDFINERDQELIKELCNDLNFPNKYCNIFSLPQKEVPSYLVNYHSGIIFNTCGYWRKMSSPTKLGEYLAAGLHILSLSGIKVIDRLSKLETRSFDILNEKKFESNLSEKKLKEIVKNIKDPFISLNSRKLAENYFDISIANKRYADLYNRISEKYISNKSQS